MEYTTIKMEMMPPLKTPVVIVGFRGWGNALDVSAGMANYIVESFQGQPVGHVDADMCFRYDELRPTVKIAAGKLQSIEPPEGTFYSISTRPGESDLFVLIADEPSLNWQRFSQELVELALDLESTAVITMGSMMDNVLHTDRIISAVSTGDDFEGILNRHGILPINYHGPSAIHTLILDACRKRAVPGTSLWSHCPAYLQGISHHGMMHRLAHLLAAMASFSLNTDVLEARWEALESQIQQLIKENPKVEGIVEQIRKKKRAGAIQNLGENGRPEGNVINLQDFIDH
jgi:proteasome assembly chaperone (PAC2) family protein